MKRMFNYIMLWFAALSTNLSFAPAEDVQFTTNDSYYNGSNHDDVDFQELYTSYTGSTSGQSGCVLQHLYPKDGDTGNAGTDYTLTGYCNRRWIVYGADVLNDSALLSETAKPVSINTSKGDLLVAPCKLTLESNSNDSAYGTSMELSTLDGKYVITVSNMYCWFCCANRPDSDRTNKGFIHTDPVNAGQWTFSVGEVIGKADKNTEITIKDNKGNGVSLNNFFYGK